MENKLKVLMEYTNNAPWLTIRHILVIEYIFKHCDDAEPILANDIKKHLDLDQSTAVRILHSLANSKISRRNRTCLNWINYRMSEEDGRHRVVTLNTLGRKVMKEYMESN